MKNLLRSKQMPGIIGIIAVIIFFIWGFIEKTYSHAWIIFLVAGLIIVILSAMKNSDKENSNKEDVNKDS